MTYKKAFWARGIKVYVDNIREAIKKLSSTEFDEYLKQLRMVLKRKYKKEVKPSDLKMRVNDFVNIKKDPKIDYFEAYIITFDEITKNGGQSALVGHYRKTPKNWRQLLIRVTEDISLPEEIIKHLEDESIAKETKALFYNCMTYCQVQNTNQFYDNLRSFNSFLKIK